MTYKHNTPTFNVDRKVVNFKDFSKDIESEKEELNKIKRQNKPNSERQQLIGGERAKYNKVTHKLDRNLSPDMVKGKIDAIEDLEESKINENQIHIPEEYSGVRMELGEFTSPEDIMDAYNTTVAREDVPQLTGYWDGIFYTEDDVDTTLDAVLDELNYSIVGDDSIEESKINESSMDENVYDELKKSSKYRKLVDNFRNAIRDFENGTSDIYDEGDTDQYMAFQNVLQDALDEAQ
jgi:hypothetical protein